jgi:hypothetical protein
MSLPSRREDNPPNWMVVAKTNDLTEATMIVGRLKSLGIPAFVQRESLSTVLGLSWGPLSEAKVLVPEDYYDAAMATLEPDDLLWLDDGEADDDDYEEDDDERDAN